MNYSKSPFFFFFDVIYFMSNLKWNYLRVLDSQSSDCQYPISIWSLTGQNIGEILGLVSQQIEKY